MIAFVIRRVFQSVVVLLIVGLIAFLMFRYVGDPIESLLGQERTFEDIANLRERLGLNDPFVVQYFNFLGVRFKASLVSPTVPVFRFRSLLVSGCQPHWNWPLCRACSH